MARPPLVLETWGKIRRALVDGKPTAVARYRDSDGVTRLMQRQGQTLADAERVLLAALRTRLTPSDGLNGDSTIAALAGEWWAEYAAKKRAPATVRRYRSVLDGHVIKGVGEIRIREATVSRLDRFIKAIAENTGGATAKICIVVLSGMFDMAARHDAVKSNPMQSVAAVVNPERIIRAYSLDDVAELRSILRAYDSTPDKRGMTRTTDIADIADMYLATGCRTGEVLAIRWKDIDLAATPPTVSISGTVALDAAGKNHIQPHPKSETSKRGLKLPPFAVAMLMNRRLSAHTVFVFPSSVGTLRAPTNFLVQWRDALAGTRFEGDVPKLFRSSVATLVKDQSGAESAKEQLGHSSVKITEGHYIKPAHQAPDLTAILESFNVITQSDG